MCVCVCVGGCTHDVLVPDDGLGRVERHLVERLQLRRPLLVARDEQLEQQLRAVGGGVLRVLRGASA